MASFAELISDVITLTNRPDLQAETKLAVKQATLKMHQTDFYPKDVFETGLIFDPIDYFQSIAYRTLIPQWRALKYLRKYSDGQAGAFFEILTPEQTVDRYNVNKENICYVAGENIEVRSSTQDTNMLIGCYVHPVITDAGFNSWIAVEHPYAIVYEAASAVFKAIGWDEQANFMKQNVQEQIGLLRSSQLLAQGY